jgi:CBS domain-containing protein
MQVQEIMDRHARAVAPEANLATLGRVMGDTGCGIVTVVDVGGRVVGVFTDRDFCLTVATSDQRPSEIRAGQVMSRDVVTCREDASLDAALETMRRRELRRLPVLDSAGRFAGLLSLDDVLQEERIDAAHRAGLYPELAAALRATCNHRSPVVEPWG